MAIYVSFIWTSKTCVSVYNKFSKKRASDEQQSERDEKRTTNNHMNSTEEEFLWKNFGTRPP